MVVSDSDEFGHKRIDTELPEEYNKQSMFPKKNHGCPMVSE